MRKLGLLLMVMFATSSFAQGTSPFKTSFYTEIKLQHCLTTYSTEWEEVYEIDGSVQECPGFSGYQVFVKSGDARSWLELRYNGITTSFSDEIMRSTGSMVSLVTEIHMIGNSAIAIFINDIGSIPVGNIGWLCEIFACTS